MYLFYEQINDDDGDHPRIRGGNVVSRVCLCVCVSVCLSAVLLAYRKFIFGVRVHLQNVQVTFVYQGH